MESKPSKKTVKLTDEEKERIISEYNKKLDEEIDSIITESENKPYHEENISEINEKYRKIAFKVIAGVLAVNGGLFIFGMGTQLGRKQFINTYLDDKDNVSSIIVCNGEYTINDEITVDHFLTNDDLDRAIYPKKIHNEINNVEYEINYYDSKSLVIYTYSEDDDVRKEVTNYIVSNITIDKNNNVYIDENNLSDDGYQMYITNIVTSSNEEIQRTRSN